MNYISTSKKANFNVTFDKSRFIDDIPINIYIYMELRILDWFGLIFCFSTRLSVFWNL
jgi:hypothetical protein